MGKKVINERILTKIQESSGDDKTIKEFLEAMLFVEAEHPGQWWWKETYKKGIEKYSKEWGGNNEN